jgi:hypothetical protein
MSGTILKGITVGTLRASNRDAKRL